MHQTDQLRYDAQTRTIQDLVFYYRNRQLNLSPNFQRDSVWSKNDREKLVDSVLKNYLIPALFLHRSEQTSGDNRYDVIDGKQRLETVFRFMGVIPRQRFTTETVLLEESGKEKVDWNLLKKRQLQSRLTEYKLQVIFVEGDLSSIIDLFVRINSTGRALTSQEM